MEIIFYSTKCPKCSVLEKKLKSKGLSYTECNDVDAMLIRGIKSAPALEVDGQLLDFMSANRFLNDLEV